MRYEVFSPVLLLAIGIMLASPAYAYDDLPVPPPAPAGTVLKPLTNESIQTELDQRLADRFRTAAGSSSQLTAQQAKDSGWGFISDHFAQIDKGHQGYVTFKQIQAFIDARSLGNPVETRARARAAAAIQRIE
ncbi:hypothetical protein HB779_06575 [Phyllobacterium sp. 628]|uniref:hypothetical protein n=1 Tax=Phyllobacterium sp. 628 TaxID=2718938 RepID=UPI00166279AC|nr:hypothetical protein [Phyllobacterium sp. 628]QND51600.1 hypothetical protein HB779_06575 [Phyllobacterium sp. 628]